MTLAGGMSGVTSEMHRSSSRLTDLEATLVSLRASLQPEIDAARATWFSQGSLREFNRVVDQYDMDYTDVRQRVLAQAAAHETGNREYSAAEAASHTTMASIGPSTGMQQALNG